MVKRIDTEYIFEDNDASSSEFGWDFQENAGIFLFLHYLQDVDSIAIESKYQDIEIIGKDGIIYAQAKALQNEQTMGTENAKLRDTLVSLAKLNINAQDSIIYISNLYAPIDGEKDRFRNEIVQFVDCAPQYQTFIAQQVQIVIKKLETQNEDEKTSPKVKRKNLALIDRLKSFKYHNLSIASIYPFSEKGDRYKIIKEKVLEVLGNIMDVEPSMAVVIRDKILRHWQQQLKFNATIADNGNDRKHISKRDFVWTVVALIAEKIEADFIEQTLSESIDSAIEEECRNYLSKEENVYHERFEFMNAVITDYEKFKSTVPRGVRTDEAFIGSDVWKKYIPEFEDIKDPLLQEFVVKCYMYKMINKNRQFLKIKNGVNLCT